MRSKAFRRKEATPSANHHSGQGRTQTKRDQFADSGDLRRTHARPAPDGQKSSSWDGQPPPRPRNLIRRRTRPSGVTVVFSEEANTAIHEKAELLRNEFVIAVSGIVKLRDADTVNKNIPTGEVELVADELRILNEAKHPPFLPSDTSLANEEMRLKYRYIDLRRDAMQFNIELRHKVALAIRDYLAAQGFFEIETPFMTRSTPEGARDYLVQPQPGNFAAPQSPQPSSRFDDLASISTSRSCAASARGLAC